jgi:hypothetical protein
MPLKLNVGLSKKVGLPDYGSLGASCHVEVELAGDVLSDPDAFHRHVKNAFVACRQAVEDELARQDGQSQHTGRHSSASPADADGRPQSRQRRGANSRNGHANGSASVHAQKPPARASQKQIDYARQLAGQIQGLGVRQLESLAERMFHKPFAELTTLDASGLIDMLKDIQAGKIDVDAALNGAVT